MKRRPITFEVPGVPQVQGNHRVSRAGYTYDANPNLRAWRKAVGTIARREMLTRRVAEPYAGAVYLELEFVMPRTKAMRRDPAPHMTKRPDSLKLARAIEDALAGIVYRDDSQIIHHDIRKRRARIGEMPHARIRCHEIPEPTAPREPNR